MPEDDARAVEEAFRAAATRLHAAGFLGAFGIDAWRTSDRLQPLGELNARWTFGHVARAWADHLGIARGRFVLGKDVPAAGAIVLLSPGAEDPTCAWLQPI